jgi:hypothetical protein
MIDDFEVVKIGYTKEIQLSRDLARAIERCLQDPQCPIPLTVRNAYENLKGHYDWQIENGVQ